MTQGVISARDRIEDLVLDADTVVVGSGAGGAVVATELATAGEDVVVLEEGANVPGELLGKMRASESLRHVWRDAGMTIAVGVGDTPAINVTMGKCIGGSSVVTGGVCFRIPENVLDVWSKEHDLPDYSPKAMERYYEHVERAIHVEEVPVRLRSRGVALFEQGATARGVQMKPMRRNTAGCNGCGRCNFGCPHGAKMSVDISYLPRAIAAGARVYSHVRVDRVDIDRGRAVGVSGRLLDRPLGKPGARLRVRAKRVVVAAGAWHTPLVLRRSGVGRRSGAVGRNLTLHPGFRVFAEFDTPVRGWKGALQSMFSDAYEEEGITLTALFVPVGVLGATMPGIGAEHAEHASRIDHLAMFGGIIHDAGGGRIWSTPGREPFVTYRMSRRDRALVPRIVRILAETFFAAGARKVYLPVMGHPPVDADGLTRIDLERVPARRIEASSQHPLGTARMGSDRSKSVVDPDGRAWDVENLYVADGSILPTSLGVNPQLSIMTVATRIAWKMLGR